MHAYSRIICIILDGVGVGELPDADQYGDVGSNSIANTARVVGSLHLPNMAKLGLGNITLIEGVAPESSPLGCFGKMKPRSPGKDSISGHWEIMGCILDRPFPVYPDGFPEEVIGPFEKAIGRKVLGNKPASGTDIIRELGEAHVKTGRPVLYTSQDSVFQIAAHEDIIPVEELYAMCRKARVLLVPPHDVARVIARPFSGEPGAFYRTPNRKDFSLPPPGRTVLDALCAAGKKVIGVGKIHDIFAGRGIPEVVPTKNNREGMNKTMDLVKEKKGDFVFVNLIDFDMMWGHRNDARAYAIGLEEFDSFLNVLLPALPVDDLLVITSDHGCDPTTPSTDHSREYVPLLVFGNRMPAGRDLGLRESYADVGKSVADNFGLREDLPGDSFLEDPHD